MLAKTRSSLTYANVMATVAVFVALGGTSYAVATGSIDSRELKNNSVAGKDIRNSTIRSGDVGNGTLLARDFKVGALPAGPRGETGPRGPAGGTNVVTRVAVGPEVSPNASAGGDAQCNPGERAVGGGVGFQALPAGTISAVTDVIFANQPMEADGTPVEAGDVPTRWRGGITNGFNQARVLLVSVICASP